jgi:hypothetical protein
MKPHQFEPFTYYLKTTQVKTPKDLKPQHADWCSFLDVPFAELHSLNDEEMKGHFCTRTKDDPIHAVPKVCHRCLSTKKCTMCKLTNILSIP